MITKTIDENLISVIPEDSEDLLNLRRIIRENDKVIGIITIGDVVSKIISEHEYTIQHLENYITGTQR